MGTLDNVTAALKTVQKGFTRQWHQEFDFMKWLPTREDFGGKNWTYAVGTDEGGGNSHDFATAQAEEDTDNNYENFVVTRVRDYALIYIDNEAIEASEKDEWAFAELLTDKVDGAMNRLKRTLAYELHGDGGGSIARISSVVTAGASGVLQLTNVDDIFKFSKNQKLQASTDTGLGGAGVRGGTPGYVKVTGIDEDLGRLTVDNTTYISGLTANDYLFPRGNYNRALAGLNRWLPSSSDLSTYPTLFGLNRSSLPNKLAGIRFDGSAYGLAECFERAAKRARSGHAESIDAFWVNSTTYTNLSLDMGDKARRETFKIGNWGYDTFGVQAYGRKIPVLCDDNVPSGIAWGLTRKTWVWKTLGNAPKYLTPPGSKTIVKPAADGVEARLGWRGNLGCLDPSKNMRIALPT